MIIFVRPVFGICPMLSSGRQGQDWSALRVQLHILIQQLLRWQLCSCQVPKLPVVFNINVLLCIQFLDLTAVTPVNLVKFESYVRQPFPWQRTFTRRPRPAGRRD